MITCTDITAEYTEVDASTLPEWVKFGICTRDGGKYSNWVACANGLGAGSPFRRDGEKILVLANGEEILEAALAERKELTLDEAEKIIIEDEDISTSEAMEEAFYAVGSWDPHVQMDLVVLDGNAFKIEAWTWAGAEVVTVMSDEFRF